MEVEDGRLVDLQKAPPLDALGVVGLAWAMASRADKNDNASSAQNYLNETIKVYKEDTNALKFFNALVPVLYGVVAKLSAAREMLSTDS